MNTRPGIYATTRQALTGLSIGVGLGLWGWYGIVKFVLLVLGY